MLDAQRVHRRQNVGVLDTQVVVLPVRIAIGEPAPAIIERNDPAWLARSAVRERAGERIEILRRARKARQAENGRSRRQGGAIVAGVKFQSVRGRIEAAFDRDILDHVRLRWRGDTVTIAAAPARAGRRRWQDMLAQSSFAESRASRARRSRAARVGASGAPKRARYIATFSATRCT